MHRRKVDVTKQLHGLLVFLFCTIVSVTANADTETPTTHITSDLSNLTAGTVTFSGKANDEGGSGVDRVFVAIRNSAGLFYYDGAFRPEDTVNFRHLNVANGTDNWSFSVPLPAGTFEVTARARDGARNQNPRIRDRRTVVVSARSGGQASGSNSFVQGNTLVFPDNGYYQVQTVNGSRNICEGRRSCDVEDGTYVVINHTTGQRFNNVVVGSRDGSTGSSAGSGNNSGGGGIAVNGNIIRFANNDYYQVQTSDGSRNICEGQRSCDVQDGTYVVINHTTGQRFGNIVVGNNGGSGGNTGSPDNSSNQSGITVENGVIRFPDNGYYQVQTSDGSRNICEGERSCTVPNGTYTVINHTTGQRISDFVVGSNTSNPAPSAPSAPVESIITVTGNTISWPDNGYYQVQTSDGSVNICEGERSCTVPPGIYRVINHTTGERLRATVGDPGNIPIINQTTWPDILRNAITTLNGVQVQDLHDRVLERIRTLTSFASADSSLFGPATGSQELVDLGLTLQPLQNPDDDRLLDYVCSNGGTLTLTLSPVSLWISNTDNCFVDDVTINGSFRHNSGGPEGVQSTIDGTSFNFADGSQFSISGEHRTDVNRTFTSRSISWTNMSFSELSGSSNYSVTDFNVTRESTVAPTSGFGSLPIELEDGSTVFSNTETHSASARGSFNVTADWTSFQPFSVNSDLSLGGGIFFSLIEEERPQQWTDGSFSVVAPDGSSVTLEPLPNDDSQAVVTVSGLAATQLVSWNDGFQVYCRADRLEISLCQPELEF